MKNSINLNELFRNLNSKGTIEIKNTDLIERANEQTVTLGISQGQINYNVYNKPFQRTSLATILGIKVIPDLVEGAEIPYIDGSNLLNVQVLDEGESYVNNAIEKTKDTLNTKRFVHKQTVTPEYLYSQNIADLLLDEALFYIEQAAVKEILDVAATLNTVTGITSTDFKSLISELNTNQGLFSPYIVTSVDNYLNAVDSASGNTNIFETTGHLTGKVYGTPIIGTDLITGDTAVLADFSKASIAYFGELQIIINPFKSDNYWELTYTRMADTSINPYAVVSV